MENNYRNKKTKKINFKEKKDCCINSIKETEFFLSNLNKALKAFKFYKFLK